MPLYNFDDLVTQSPLPIPSIISNGLFPECGTMLITGKTECGKSVIGFDMAISLVLQQPLFKAIRKKHGQQGKPYFPINRACKVLYLDNELGPQGCHERLKLFRESRQIGVSMKSEFQIVSGDYDPLLLHETQTEKKSFQNLKKLVGEIKPDVLIVDPFGDYHTMDENSNEMRLVFRYLRALQNEFKFASILLHHESDKPQITNTGLIVEKEGTGRSRGHSCIAQSVDTYLSLRRLSKGSQTFMEMQWEKVRHQARPPSGYLFVDLARMHVQWAFSNREHSIPAKQQAFLDEYRKTNPQIECEE